MSIVVNVDEFLENPREKNLTFSFLIFRPYFETKAELELKLQVCWGTNHKLK